MSTWQKTTFPGVRFREHTKRKHNGRPDRYFTIRYRANGEAKEERLGWASEGWTAQQASIQLAQLKKAHVTGEGATTLQEKRTLAAEIKKADTKKRADEEREKITLKDVAAKYVEWAKKNKATWSDDKIRLDKHVMPVLGDFPLIKIQIPELELLKERCQEKGLAPATVLQCLAVTRATFNYAIKHRYFTGVNPSKGVKLPKPDNTRVRFLSRKETEDLLDMAASYNTEMHDMCLVSLYTGMRSGEIMSLKWTDLDFEHDLITVRNPKNGETRQVFMTGNVKEMLQSRLIKADDSISPYSIVFPSKYGKQRGKISKSFERLVNKLGLNDGVEDEQHRVVFHTLRHTFASWLAIQGETLLTIKELLGHKTIQMTMRYAHLIPDQKRRAVERLCG